MQTNFAPAEIQFKKAMGILALVYLLVTALFIFAPEKGITASNAVGGVFKMDKAPAPTEIGEVRHADKPMVMGRGYVSMAAALSTFLLFISAACFFDPRKFRCQMPAFLALNGLTALYGFFFYYLQLKSFGVKYFGTLVVGIFPALVCLVAGILWWRAKGASPSETPRT